MRGKVRQCQLILCFASTILQGSPVSLPRCAVHQEAQRNHAAVLEVYTVRARVSENS